MSPIDNPVIPKGSTVLITGVNGFIASHIADQFLTFGYKVRGTTRDAKRGAWTQSFFDNKYGPGNFELVTVADITADDAYDEGIKGVSAVVHTASDVSFKTDPHEVVPGTIKATVNALATAAKEPSVKRFVLTSSSSAALIPKPNEPVTVTVDSWNDEVVAVAYADPPPSDGYTTYATSKTLGEREAWKFMREQKPAFTFNAILPNLNLGELLDPVNQAHTSTYSFLAALFKGNSAPLASLPAQYFVDVQDVALLHVAAAIHPGVESERIFAFAEPENGDKLLAILRKLYPDRSFPANFQSDQDLSDIVPRKRAEEILRYMGKDGWTSLEESVRRNTKNLV